jgi:hypothetical protein
MYLRISSALLLLSLAACSQGNSEEGQAEVAGGSKETVPCAFGEVKEFKNSCMVERSTAEGKSYVTLWHPDGGFRRLEVLDGGKGYATADGADDVEGGPNGKEFEVVVGDAHYLMPVGNAAQP